MVITENEIRKIVAESVSSLLSELNMGVIGGRGPISESELEDPAVIFAKEHNLSSKILRRSRENSRYRVNLEKIFGDTLAYKVWKNYYNAMMSKPGKKAVKFVEWMDFVCNGKNGQKILAFSVDGNYIFGMWVQGFFLSAYFAPIGFKGMAMLIKDLCQYNNIIFAVTQDLSPMFERLGVPKADKTHDAPWRGKVVTKDVFGTSDKAIEMGFKILDYAIADRQKAQSNIINGDESIDDLKAKFNSLSPAQKKEFKKKLGSILQQKYPDLLANYKI